MIDHHHTHKRDPEVESLMGGIEVDDLAHALHVASLADDLFHLSWPLHGMGEHEAGLLRRGALLHDAGIMIAYRGHHKESLRLIEQGTFDGLSRDEKLMVACIARYHRKALPKKRHRVYGDLPRALRQQIDELGGILRLADAFDYEHDGGVARLVGHVMSASEMPVHVVIRAVHHYDDHETVAEILARADYKRDLFERAFHCRVSIAPELESVARDGDSVGRALANGRVHLVN